MANEITPDEIHSILNECDITKERVKVENLKMMFGLITAINYVPKSEKPKVLVFYH